MGDYHDGIPTLRELTDPTEYTGTVKYGDHDKIAAAAKDGDIAALAWSKSPARMAKATASSASPGSIATGARPSPAAPTPRLFAASASVHADAPTSVQLSADAQKQFDAVAATSQPNVSRALGGNASPVGGA